MAGFPARALILGAVLALAAAAGQAQTQAPDAPAQPTPPAATKPSAGGDFPFPENAPKKTDNKDFPFPDKADQPSVPPPAAEKDVPQPAPPPGFSSSATLHDEGSEGAVHPADPARASKDASVAKLYWNLGNYEGAYMRYRDAVLYAPRDAPLWFGLAEAERGLGRYSKARADYGQVIKLAPESKQSREAKKILRKLPTKDRPQPQGPGPKLP